MVPVLIKPYNQVINGLICSKTYLFTIYNYIVWILCYKGHMGSYIKTMCYNWNIKYCVIKIMRYIGI